MSELTCTCPHCGQELNVDSEFSGQAVACPQCSGEFTIPDAPAAPPSNAPVLQAPGLAAGAPPILNAPANAPAMPPQMQMQPQGGPRLQAPPPPPPGPGQNPYQSPASNVGGPQSMGGYPGIAPSTIQLFGATKGWVMLFAIIGFIYSAIVFGLGLLAAFAGVSAGAVGDGMMSGLILAAIGGIYFLPSFRLWQYASAIGMLRISPTQHALDTAVDRQRSFWKTIGIFTLVAFALLIILIIIAMSAAASVSSSFKPY